MSNMTDLQKKPPHLWVEDAAITHVLDAYNAIDTPWHIPLTPEFIAAIMFVESKGDPVPISTSGARGLLQVKPHAALGDRPPVREALWPLSGALMRAAGEAEHAKVTEIITSEGQVAAGLSVFLDMAKSLDVYAGKTSAATADNMRGNLYLLALGYKAGNAGLQADFAALGLIEDEKFNLAYPPKIAAYARFMSERFFAEGDVDAAQAFKQVELDMIEGAERVGINVQSFVQQVNVQYAVYDDNQPHKNDFAHTWPGYRFDVAEHAVQVAALPPLPPKECDALLAEFARADGSGYDLTPFLNDAHIDALPVSYLGENTNVGAIDRGDKVQHACNEFAVQVAQGAIPVLDISVFEEHSPARTPTPAPVRLADNALASKTR